MHHLSSSHWRHEEKTEQVVSLIPSIEMFFSCGIGSIPHSFILIEMDSVIFFFPRVYELKVEQQFCFIYWPFSNPSFFNPFLFLCFWLEIKCGGELGLYFCKLMENTGSGGVLSNSCCLYSSEIVGRGAAELKGSRTGRGFPCVNHLSPFNWWSTITVCPWF